MDAVQQHFSITEEILEFLTTSPTLEQIIAFQPSEALKQRSHYLMDQNRKNMLAAEERAEFDELLRMNHFVNMLKIRARQKLTTT